MNTEALDVGGPLHLPDSLSQQAYGRIRNALVHSAILPGAAISEPQLSGQLGISRTVLREALVRLEVEGYVSRSATGRWRVSLIDRDDVRDIYACRGVLEGLAASSAAQRIDERTLSMLKTKVQTMREEYDANRIDRAAERSTEFHDLIVSAADNKKLESLMNLLRPQILQNRSRILQHRTRGRSFLDQNESLYEAIAIGDSATAERIARASAEEDMASVLALYSGAEGPQRDSVE